MIQSFGQARKDIQHALVGPVLASVVTGPCGDLQILAHVQVGEDAAAFGYIGYSQPRYLVGCGACAVFSTYGNGAAAGGHVPHDGSYKRAFAHAVAADRKSTRLNSSH